jgi:tetratricopeptide (TPR) repeat protein
MDFSGIVAWARDQLIQILPDWLDAYAGALPDWALLLALPLLLIVLVGTCLRWLFGLIKAFKDAFTTVRPPAPAPNPATAEGQAAIHALVEQVRADNAGLREQIDRITVALAPPMGMPALGPAEKAAEAAAMVELVTDPAPAAKEAARDLAAGDIRAAFAVLELEARNAEAAAAEKWRRLGALARGNDTARARAAYAEAFRLQPSDFWTCIELARLQQEAGDLAAARRAAAAAEQAAANPRERSAANDELGNVLVQGGDLAAAKARYEASLALSERLAAEDPGSAQARRDVSVSLERLGDVRWSDVAARLQAMKDEGTLFPADERFLELARQREASE